MAMDKKEIEYILAYVEAKQFERGWRNVTKENYLQDIKEARKLYESDKES